MNQEIFYRTFEFYSHGLENHDDSSYRYQRKVLRWMGCCLWRRQKEKNCQESFQEGRKESCKKVEQESDEKDGQEKSRQEKSNCEKVGQQKNGHKENSKKEIG
ncbi:MAG: hypothetical protein ACPGPS_07390 [Rubripirellula sp.]